MSINSISPIDGRYFNKVFTLSDYFSEKALIKNRILVEIKYLISLTNERKLNLKKLSNNEIDLLNGLIQITDDDAEIIKKIENSDYNDIPATNHDVKAIEYFLKFKLSNTSIKEILEMIHFGLTSEDVNNISYALMIKDGFNKVIFPELINLYDNLLNLAKEYKNLPMLARTHGQPASPTTFGKEILVFINRLKQEFEMISKIKILSKLNGATGNFNAHFIAYPEIDWINFSKKFINSLNGNNELKIKYCSRMPLEIQHNPITTQIEPHDSYCRLFDSMKRINTILIDFCNDLWRYISDAWIKQKPVKGEVGSSAMPHKINPIDFENAEGNLGIANSLLTFFSSKLMISRLQRDLSDSTVLRNIGASFAHSLLAYKSILKGLSKIEINKEVILNTLESSIEVLAEAYQSILRTSGIEKPYELLKELTRGKKITLKDYHTFIETLSIDKKVKDKLKSITLSSYTGLAPKIVDDFSPEIF